MPLTRLSEKQPENFRFTREMGSRPATWNAEKRTLDVVMSTGAMGRRFDWWEGEYFDEALRVSPESVLLDRANEGAPIFCQHRGEFSHQIGEIVPGSVRIEGGEVVATVRLFEEADLMDGPDGEMARIVRNIIKGNFRKWSIGYDVLDWEHVRAKERTDGGEVDLWTAIKWRIYELSAVGIPFDNDAKTRSAETNNNEHRAEEARLTSHVNPNERTKNMPDDILTPTPEQVAAADAERAQELERAKKEAKEAERQRQADIRNACRAFGLADSEAEKHIAADTPALDAMRAMSDAKAKLEGETHTASGMGSPFRAGASGAENLRGALENVLTNRLTGGRVKLERDGQDFDGIPLLEMGRQLMMANGDSRRYINNDNIVEFMVNGSRSHTTSDFPILLGNVVNRSIFSFAQVEPLFYTPFVKTMSANDFKELYHISLDMGTTFKKAAEGKGYDNQYGEEVYETMKLETWERAVSVSRQVIRNNDSGAIMSQIESIGRGMSATKNAQIAALLAANPTMNEDDEALFSSAHGNVSGAAADPSLTTLEAAAMAMAAQTTPKGDPLDYQPKIVLVSTKGTQRLKLMQFLAAINPTQISETRPGYYDNIIPVATNRIPANVWYVFEDPSKAPVIAEANLLGNNGFVTEILPSTQLEGLKVGCFFDWACGAVGWRGAYRNAAA